VVRESVKLYSTAVTWMRGTVGGWLDGASPDSGVDPGLEPPAGADESPVPGVPAP